MFIPKHSFLLIYLTLFSVFYLNAQNEPLAVIDLSNKNVSDARLNDFLEDFLYFNGDVDDPFMGFYITPMTKDTILFSGQVSTESLSNNSIYFLSQGLQSYIHLIVVNDNVLYVVNMRNSLTEILKSVQQNEIFDQKAIINTIKQLHKQNFDNRYSEGNIPGEIDDNGEWKPLIEYDPNKW